MTEGINGTPVWFAGIESGACDVLSLAQRYLRFGFSLVPLDPQSKEPAMEVLPRGDDGKPTWAPFQQRKPTEEELQRWFPAGTRRGIGLIQRELVVAVDGDTPEALAWMLAHLPHTPAKTRTARGEHWFYQRPSDVNIQSEIPVSDTLTIEIKQKGQYVVSPGSVHPTGVRYKEIEPWPRSFKDLPLFAVGAVGAPAPRQRAEPLPDVINNGHRNNTLFREGCRLRRLGFDEPEIRAALVGVNQHRCHPPLPVRDVEAIAKGSASYKAENDTFPATETGDAEFFVACHSDSVRYDHRRGSWHHYDGNIWVPQTNGEVFRLAIDALRARQRAAVGHEKRLQWAAGGEKRARQTSMLAIAQNLLPVADAGDQWDRDPWLLGAPNGVIDLRTGSLRPGRPEDRITMRVRVPFDPSAACPLFGSTIGDIFDCQTELIDYVQRAFGYSLTADCREEVFFLLWGHGANGKSTLIGIVTHVLGDYADDLPFSALERSRFGAGIPNDIAKLVGRRCVTASESNEVRLNEARIKALTGRDPITARFLHQEFFTFEPVAKFWLATNTKPEVRDDSEGFWRRVHLIPFTQSFIGREDKKLKDKLRAEASGVLNWLVQGCLMWQRDGLKPPKAVVDATSKYREESQQLVQFIDACCLLRSDAKVQAGNLYRAYVDWCKAEQQSADLNQRTFGQAIRGKFQATGSGPVIYHGIGLLDLL